MKKKVFVKAFRLKAMGVVAILCCSLLQIQAQSIGREALPAQGGEYVAAGVDLTFTLGETFPLTFTGGSNMLTQGFQQPLISSGALPVTFLYIEAEPVDNSFIRLHWATAVEINNYGFDVERSSNAAAWAKIGFAQGHNNSTIQNEYYFNDMGPAPNLNYYYRLKQWDNNGQFKYSELAAAAISAGEQQTVIDIYPNPSTSNALLSISSGADQQITLELFNIIGQRVMNNSYHILKGDLNTNKIDLNLTSLASGTYMVSVSSVDGVFVKKLVVAR